MCFSRNLPIWAAYPVPLVVGSEVHVAPPDDTVLVALLLDVAVGLTARETTGCEGVLVGFGRRGLERYI